MAANHELSRECLPRVVRQLYSISASSGCDSRGRSSKIQVEISDAQPKWRFSMLNRASLLMFVITLTTMVLVNVSRADAQNLLPIQTAITKQVQATADPPPPTSDPINA